MPEGLSFPHVSLLTAAIKVLPEGRYQDHFPLYHFHQVSRYPAGFCVAPQIIFYNYSQNLSRRPILQLPAVSEEQLQYLIYCPFASLLHSEPKFCLQSRMMNTQRTEWLFIAHLIYQIYTEQ